MIQVITGVLEPSAFFSLKQRMVAPTHLRKIASSEITLVPILVVNNTIPQGAKHVPSDIPMH